ncbi:Late embryogenesis abundant protein [Poriferisphaera corsica]|uniref:Late embryogenesis abundant protein n=1 Tax=Poriferisphaera corsica TaxID=2528020 RepID=A0A517YTM7_9BACT|nr:LEA type 2 family protein [Poriferisphaera corsica]QDU33585.1 Late embryogenesis abundant protein [Poriferisphaera corsica]
MTRQPLHLLTLLIATLLTLGCSIQRPFSNVRSVEVTDRSPQGIRMAITVDLENPNAVPLPLTRTNYRVYLEGAGVFESSELGDATLPAGGSQTVSFSAAFPLTDSIPIDGKRYAVFGEVYYRTPGELREILDQYRFPQPSSSFIARGVIQPPSTEQ